MAIEFTLAPEHEEIRSRVRSFIEDTVQPRIKGFDDEGWGGVAPPQAETALDMMVDRSLHRYSHGSLLAEKQGVQWLKDTGSTNAATGGLPL